MPFDYFATVIGAGIVGLSVAGRAARRFRNGVLLLERHGAFGKETSSRNSEVIHASVYYPKGSLKAKLCAEGNEMMYELCKKECIPFKNTGKLLVATSQDDLRRLSKVFLTAVESGGQGLRILNEEEVRAMEPNLRARAAIYCPTSGIVDSHSLMQYWEGEVMNGGGDVAYHSTVTAINKTFIDNKQGFEVSVREEDGSTDTVTTEVLVNCAGNGSENISRLAGIDVVQAGYLLTRCKGMYYRVQHGFHNYPSALVYPLPAPGIVGIHTCPDVQGGMRLGPYDTWLDEPSGSSSSLNSESNSSTNAANSNPLPANFDYSVPDGLETFFADAVRPFLPFVKPEDLTPDTAGYHPKIQRRGEPVHDFVIRHEEDRGLRNFFNLVGIESPGLTCSPAIAKMVEEMIVRSN